jgi:hypothetical protein
MSLDDLKKKAKFSVDEMYNTDNKPVGKTEIRTEVKLDVNNNDNQHYKKQVKKKYNFPSSKDGMVKRNMNFKLTFNVNEDTFLAFNEVYASRIIEGNKTEKSVLICEAIRLLYESEWE